MPKSKARRSSIIIKKRPSSEDGDFETESDAPFKAPPIQAKREVVIKAFAQIWSDLFSSPVHLDSALSKQHKSTKSILARTLPTILLRPASQAEEMGIGVPAGEPWQLKSDALKSWKPARVLAERLYENMIHRPTVSEPVRDDFPPHMVSEWEKDWGSKRMAELIETLALEAPLALRASRKFGAAEVLDELKKGKFLGVSAKLSTLSPLGIRLSGYAAVLGTPTYEKGAFEIQDEGSQLMSFFALWPDLFSKFLSKEPGQVREATLPQLPEPSAWTVVDACSGAGGKSLALADALQGKGRVYSYDISEKKLLSLRRRAKHAGFNNIQAVALKEGEEEASLKRFRRTANVVLVDAPCSGWGVLRRNPDIKWRQTPEVLERMPKIQLRLLTLYSQLVAPGGRLVFGVCTFRKAETTEIVDKFLKENPGFVACAGGYLGPGPCDGFFMQAFERSAK